MRIVFGVLSLLVVLAIVGSLAKKQLQAVSGSVTTQPRAAAIEGVTVPQQAQNIQQQVRNDTVRALEQGADRNARADP